MAKEEWELGRLKIMKEEEERRAELEEDEMLFTYSRDDAYNQVKRKKSKSKKRRSNSGSPSKSTSPKESKTAIKPSRSSRRISKEITKNTSQVENNNGGEVVCVNGLVVSEKSHQVDGAVIGMKSANQSTGSGADSKTKRLETDSNSAAHKAKEVPVIKPKETTKLYLVNGPGNTRLLVHNLTLPSSHNLHQKVNNASSVAQSSQSPKASNTIDSTNSVVVSNVQAWSNPNLVIRTRRASKEIKICDKDELESSISGNGQAVSVNTQNEAVLNTAQSPNAINTSQEKIMVQRRLRNNSQDIELQSLSEVR